MDSGGERESESESSELRGGLRRGGGGGGGGGGFIDKQRMNVGR